MIRKVVLAFAALFAVVVASGYYPGFITHQMGEERMMFDLFALSLLDDITHGVTAVAALIAGLHSTRWSRLFLIGFGSYYALDAVFFLTYGLFNDKTWVQDLLLNLPHVLIAGAMLYVVQRHDRQTVPAGPVAAMATATPY